MENHKVAKKSRHTKRASEMALKKLIIAIFVVLIILIIIDRAQEKTANTDGLSLIIDNKGVTDIVKKDLLEQDGIIFLSIDGIKNTLDKTIYFEEETNLIITTSDKKVASLGIDNTSIEINGSSVELKRAAFKTEDGKIYLPISEMGNVYDMEFTYIAENKNALINYFSTGVKKIELKKDVNLKNSKSIFSKTVAKLKKGDIVFFIEEKDGWGKIRTQDGYLGYVKYNNLTNIVTERENMEQAEISEDGEILEKDITSENIDNFQNRKVVVNNILTEAVSGSKKIVKIIYNGNLKEEKFERFKIEIKPILKECGINVKYE